MQTKPGQVVRWAGTVMSKASGHRVGQAQVQCLARWLCHLLDGDSDKLTSLHLPSVKQGLCRFLLHGVTEKDISLLPGMQ